MGNIGSGNNDVVCSVQWESYLLAAARYLGRLSGTISGINVNEL